MLVVITGPHTGSNEEELNRRIQTLEQRGVNVIFIAVGDVDVKTLQRVTSPNSNVVDRVLLANDFNSIMQYGQDIPDFACFEGCTFLPFISLRDFKSPLIKSWPV